MSHFLGHIQCQSMRYHFLEFENGYHFQEGEGTSFKGSKVRTPGSGRFEEEPSS